MFIYFINVVVCGVFFVLQTTDFDTPFEPPSIDWNLNSAQEFQTSLLRIYAVFFTLLESTDLWTPGAFDSETDSILDIQDKGLNLLHTSVFL